jgi:hypothetical protein
MVIDYLDYVTRKHPFNLLALSVSPAHAHLQFSTAIDSIYYVSRAPGGDTLRAMLAQLSYCQVWAHFLPSFTCSGDDCFLLF